MKGIKRSNSFPNGEKRQCLRSVYTTLEKFEAQQLPAAETSECTLEGPWRVRVSHMIIVTSLFPKAPFLRN